jgi:hypothetical protein
MIKQTFSTTTATLEEIELFFNNLISCFEKKEQRRSIDQEDSSLEISFQILYPEVKGNNTLPK